MTVAGAHGTDIEAKCIARPLTILGAYTMHVVYDIVWHVCVVTRFCTYAVMFLRIIS